MSVDRNTQMATWLAQQLGHDSFEIQALAGDASFRRYARANVQGKALVLMDAPTSHEDSRPFVHIAQILAGHGVRVPQILAHDLAQGFLLLEDFGNTLLSQVLNDSSVDAWYGQAINQLLHLQQTPAAADWPLPLYDNARLTTEMRLFDQWFLPHYLQRELSGEESAMLTHAYAHLAEQALQQPQVFVHRDYHSRNLMVLGDNNPLQANAAALQLGIIDFQDAVTGAITYDLVSLLRDAYVQWPAARVRDWLRTYWQRAQLQGLLPNTSLAQFEQWFDAMGAQRHLKILGIFVRLSQRDGKHGYLENLPLVLYYLLEESQNDQNLGVFSAWLREVVLPAFVQQHPEQAGFFKNFSAVFNTAQG